MKWIFCEHMIPRKLFRWTRIFGSCAHNTTKATWGKRKEAPYKKELTHPRPSLDHINWIIKQPVENTNHTDCDACWVITWQHLGGGDHKWPQSALFFLFGWLVLWGPSCEPRKKWLNEGKDGWEALTGGGAPDSFETDRAGKVFGFAEWQKVGNRSKFFQKCVFFTPCKIDPKCSFLAFLKEKNSAVCTHGGILNAFRCRFCPFPFVLQWLSVLCSLSQNVRGYLNQLKFPFLKQKWQMYVYG